MWHNHIFPIAVLVIVLTPNYAQTVDQEMGFGAPSIVKKSTQSTPTPSPITEQILGITVIVPTDSTIASPTSTLLNQLVFLKYKNEQKKIYYHFRSTRICI